MTDFFTYLTGQALQPTTEIHPVIAARFEPWLGVAGRDPVPGPDGLDTLVRDVPGALAASAQIDPIVQAASTPLDAETGAYDRSSSRILPLQVPQDMEKRESMGGYGSEAIPPRLIRPADLVSEQIGSSAFQSPEHPVQEDQAAVIHPQPIQPLDPAGQPIGPSVSRPPDPLIQEGQAVVLHPQPMQHLEQASESTRPSASQPPASPVQEDRRINPQVSFPTGGNEARTTVAARSPAPPARLVPSSGEPLAVDIPPKNGERSSMALPPVQSIDRHGTLAVPPLISDTARGREEDPNPSPRSARGSPEPELVNPPEAVWTGQPVAPMAKHAIPGPSVHTPLPTTEHQASKIVPDTQSLVEPHSTASGETIRLSALRPSNRAGPSLPEVKPPVAKVKDYAGDAVPSQKLGSGRPAPPQTLPLLKNVNDGQPASNIHPLQMHAPHPPAHPQAVTEVKAVPKPAALPIMTPPALLVHKDLPLLVEAHRSLRPGKTVEPFPRLLGHNSNSTIRPALAATPILGEGAQTSQAAATQSTAPTIHLTIGRIIVRAVPLVPPIGPTPVSARRQASVSLGDYLARYRRKQ